MLDYFQLFFSNQMVLSDYRLIDHLHPLLFSWIDDQHWCSYQHIDQYLNRINTLYYKPHIVSCPWSLHIPLIDGFRLWKRIPGSSNTLRILSYTCNKIYHCVQHHSHHNLSISWIYSYHSIHSIVCTHIYSDVIQSTLVHTICLHRNHIPYIYRREWFAFQDSNTFILTCSFYIYYLSIYILSNIYHKQIILYLFVCIYHICHHWLSCNILIHLMDCWRIFLPRNNSFHNFKSIYPSSLSTIISFKL